jgi:hypothetical protein
LLHADIGIVAQSVGAVLVATWVHDHAPAIRGMVLASPAFRVKLYVPFALPGLRFMRRLRGNFFITSYVKAKFLTHDPARIASYDSDPLLSRAISVNVLLGLQEAADRVVADAQAITVPTQLLISGNDWVVHHRPQHAFFDRLGACVKERHLLHGFLHDTLGERDRARAVDRMRAFLLRVFATPCTPPNLMDADQYGPTREEADALAAPLSPLSPARPVLGRYARQPALRRLAVGRHSSRSRYRFRFGELARLHLSQSSRRSNASRALNRPVLSRRDRVARHPAAQARRRGAPARGDGAIARRGNAGAHSRYRRGTWPLRARRGHGTRRRRFQRQRRGRAA